MEVSGQLHAPATLLPDKRSPRYPLDRRLDGPQSRSGRCGETRNPLPVKKSSTGRPVACRCTNWATSAPLMKETYQNNTRNATILSKNISNVCIIKYLFISVWLNDTQTPYTRARGRGITSYVWESTVVMKMSISRFWLYAFSAPLNPGSWFLECYMSVSLHMLLDRSWKVEWILFRFYI
jgi:hypothetical protein